MFQRIALAVIFWVSCSLPGFASSGAALIIANEHYDALRDARGAAGVLGVEQQLANMGFRVDVATDLSADAMRAALSQLSDQISDPKFERIIVVFAGYVVNAPHGTWLLGTDADRPGFTTIEASGVRLETVLAMAGARQGGAVVAIADYGFPQVLASGFQAGLPAVTQVPQGVSLLRGAGPGITAALRDLVTPGANIGAVVQAHPDTALEGFNPPYLTFLPADFQPARDADREAWIAAQAADSAQSYQAYLDAWPTGEFAAQARDALSRILNTPERVEAALNLSRDERRSIQRDLTLLGFDPRGIDGIFGNGTRIAISAWQAANRFDSTGYLNRDQVFELAQQGARRAAQLEAEAQARQQAQERRDRAYWRDTGSGQDEAGMRAYLQRYPDGIFANVAHDRLNQIQADRRAAQRAADDAAWARARQADTPRGYRSYLQQFADGLHVREARERLRQLINERRREAARAAEDAAWNEARQADTPQAYHDYLQRFADGPHAQEARNRLDRLVTPLVPGIPEPSELQRQEDALSLSGPIRQGVEMVLATRGFNPGPEDGRFDAQTRDAIRQYQSANGFQATGYLDSATMQRLFLDGLSTFLR